MNLFASFILRAVAVLMKDIIFYNSYSRRPNSDKEWVSYMSEVHLPTWWISAGNQRAGSWGSRGRRETTGGWGGVKDFVV